MLKLVHTIRKNTETFAHANHQFYGRNNGKKIAAKKNLNSNHGDIDANSEAALRQVVHGLLTET